MKFIMTIARDKLGIFLIQTSTSMFLVVSVARVLEFSIPVSEGVAKN